MASAGRGALWSAESDDEEFPVAPQFLKVLNHVSTYLGLFQIPEKFALRHRELFGEMVVLKVPTGDSWNQVLEKDRGKIWFGSTWKNFVHHYSLLPGNSLFFEYEGNSTFRVVIFDRADTEIGYPVEMETPDTSDDDDDDSPVVEMTGDVAPTESDDEYVPPVGELHASANTYSAGPSRQRADGRTLPPPRSSPRAVVAAANFESDCPFFQRTMSRCYGWRTLSLPTDFLERNNLKEHMATVKVEHSGGSCLMTLLYYRRRGRLSAGWSHFRRDRNLEEGDICVFELISRRPIVFYVTVIKSNN